MIEERTQKEFLDSMLVALSNTEDKTPNSFSYDILSAVAIIMQEMHRVVIKVSKQFDVDNLEGEALTKRVFQIAGIDRKPATYAHGEFIVTGNSGTEIPAGTVFKAGEVEFISRDSAIIGDNNQAIVIVDATVPGIAGDVIARSIDKIEPRIQGVTNVYNPHEFVNGFIEETDDDLRERFYDKLLNPPKGGNPAHYKLWATEVPGIWDAKVFRTWDGPGTVKVVLVSTDRTKVDSEKIEEVKKHILEEAPIRYEQLTVESAIPKPINLSVEIRKESSSSLERIKTDIKKSIEDYLFAITFKQDFISIAKVGGYILGVRGVTDYDNLTLNNASNNIKLNEIEIPVLGEVEVIEIE